MKILFCHILHYAGGVSRFFSRILSSFLPSVSKNRVKLTSAIERKLFSGFAPALPCATEVLDKAFRKASSGDYYEFGVFKGYAIWYAQQLAMKQQRSMRLFGFDSFEGLPAPKGIDDSGEFFSGEYACSLEHVSSDIISHGGNMKNVFLIKGFFDKTLTPGLKKKHAMKPASIVLIDSDLYSSAVTVLEFVRTLLKKDTLILFDDWNSFGGDTTRGERRAFREFLQKNPSVKVVDEGPYCWHGNMFRVTHSS